MEKTSKTDVNKQELEKAQFLFNRFIQWSKWGIVGIVGILALMAIFLVH